MYAAAQTQQGQNLRMLAYFIEFGGEVYYFRITSEGSAEAAANAFAQQQGIQVFSCTSAQLFGQYEDEFLRSMQGFDRATHPDILNREPSRIEIGTVRDADQFRSFVDESDLPAEMDAEELAILYQLTPGSALIAKRPHCRAQGNRARAP